MVVAIQVTGADRMAAVAKRLKAAGNTELQKEFRKEIRTIAAHLKPKAQEAATSLPAKSSSGSTRAAMAAAVVVKTSYTGKRAGVRLVISGAKMPPGKRALPRAYSKGTWRHPVFGNTNVWVAQTGQAKWLRNALMPEAVYVAHQLDAAIARVARKI